MAPNRGEIHKPWSDLLLAELSVLVLSRHNDNSIRKKKKKKKKKKKDVGNFKTKTIMLLKEKTARILQ